MSGEVPVVPGGEAHQDLVAIVRSQEPWSRTLWSGLRRGTLAGLTFWGLGSLIMDTTVGAAGVLFFGAMNALMDIAARRSGQLLPASTLLVGGAVSAIGGAALLVSGVDSGSTDDVVLGAWFGAFGVAGLALGLRARRQERLRERNLSLALTVPQRLPRAEFDRRLTEFRASIAPWNRRMVRSFLLGVGGIAAVAIGAILLGIEGAAADWIAGLGAAAFVAVLGGGSWYGVRHTRRESERFGLLCPACRGTLYGGLGSTRLMKLIDDAGLCPQCGAHIVEDRIT